LVAAAAPTSVWKIGDEPIAGYRLTRPLGRGGYGEVWESEAPGGLRKAIKFVPAMNPGDGSGADSELDGLRRIRDIRHPFILSIERFELVRDHLVIVMELADRSIEDRFLECQSAGSVGIPRKELLRYLAEAAEALDLLHDEFKVQHLDIKPANLFLIRSHVKVADFGLARRVEGFESRVAGGVTPIYSAPETFDGWASAHSDQYSLGIVWQEMLTGARPFPGPGPQQFMFQHLTRAPDVASLPPVDGEIVTRALSKNPRQRYGSCLALAEALQAAPDVSPKPAARPRYSDLATAKLSGDAPGLSGSVPLSPSLSRTLEQGGTVRRLPVDQTDEDLLLFETFADHGDGRSGLQALIPEPAGTDRTKPPNPEFGAARNIGIFPRGLAAAARFWLDPSPTSPPALNAILAGDPEANRLLALIDQRESAGKRASVTATSKLRGHSPTRMLGLLLPAALLEGRFWNAETLSDEDRAWCHRRCLWMSAVAGAIADLTDHPSPESAVIAGLFADVGTISMLRHQGRRYRLYWRRWRFGRDRRLSSSERSLFGFSHADASAAALDYWKFPDDLVTLIQDHHRTDRFDTKSVPLRRMHAILAAAEAAADMLEAPRADRLHELLKALRSAGAPPEEMFHGVIDAAARRLEQFAIRFAVKAPDIRKIRERFA
jgi:serine/threonine protein kinase